jgi:hypothetical protein
MCGIPGKDQHSVLGGRELSDGEQAGKFHLRKIRQCSGSNSKGTPRTVVAVVFRFIIIYDG